MIDRRHFLSSTAVAAGAAALASQTAQAQTSGESTQKFSLGYAPHPGMFQHSAGKDLLDQIRFCADEGFTAFEYNGLPNESPEMQEKIGKLLSERGMTMGVFVAYADFGKPTFARPSEDSTAKILESMKRSVEIAKRVGAKWCTVVPGAIDESRGRRLADGYQMANTIDTLRRCVEIMEPAELVMVLEPLNWYANHGGVYLQRSDHAYAICRAVDSPSCKILFDIYHQQISEGNLIENIEACWDEIAYFQTGDNPGRKEPYSGEINYQRIFARLREKGFTGVIGMEHGNSVGGKEGERKVIEAYRRADAQV